MNKKELYGWLFTFNPYTGLWYAATRDNTNCLFSDINSKLVLKSSSIDTLQELILKTDGKEDRLERIVKKDGNEKR